MTALITWMIARLRSALPFEREDRLGPRSEKTREREKEKYEADESVARWNQSGSRELLLQ
jgi:hypothetical protein